MLRNAAAAWCSLAPCGVLGEPGIVRHRQDGLRAQPRAVDGQAGIDIVQADHRQHRDLAAVGQPQRKHARAVAGPPRAGPGQPAPQRRPVEPRGHVLGEREHARLAVEAEQARAGLHEGGRVVFAGRVAVVGAEHERHAGGVDELKDLAVELGAVVALRVAEGGGVHRLRPHHGVHAVPLDGVVAHREMGVQHLADDGVGTLLAAQALVVHDVRLHEAHAQRLVRGRARMRRGQRDEAVARQQQRHHRSQRQRLRHAHARRRRDAPTPPRRLR